LTLIFVYAKLKKLCLLSSKEYMAIKAG